MRPGPLANMTVRQPMDAMKELRALDVPVIIGSNTHEGTVFVFTAFPTRMAKIIYQGLVFSFFRSSAPLVLKLYAPLSRRIADSPFPDYRLVLAQIIGDYLFRCPNQYFATLLTGVGTSVFLYEFALATRTPGFPCCDGLSCHTCELPYVFNQEYLIERDYLWNDFSSIRQDRGNFNGSETPAKDSIPDIFGASSTWIDEGDSGSYSEQSKHRFAIDKEVSRLMADYWSTFATFGDPNGQLTRNGYGSGTRPDNSPWWPNLHGTLPSDKATKDIEAQVKHKRPGKRNRISPMVGWLDYEDQDVDYPDNKSSEVEEEETSWRESIGSDRFDYSANKDDDDESDYDYPLNNLYKRRRKERADKIRRQEKKGLPRTNSPPWDKANHLDNDDEYDDSHKFMTGDEWTVDPDDSNPTSSGDYSLSRFTNSLSLNFKFNNKKSAIKRATRHNANNYMHQILFDRETAVNIIENDCICNTWNRLEYRF